MWKLPNDYSRCAITEQNKNCPLGHKCLRRIDNNFTSCMSFSGFKGGLDCEEFIEADEDAIAHYPPVNAEEAMHELLEALEKK